MGQANGPHLLAKSPSAAAIVSWIFVAMGAGNLIESDEGTRTWHVASLLAHLAAASLLLVDGTHHLRTTHACERGWDVGSFPFRRSRLGSLAWAPASDHLRAGRSVPGGPFSINVSASRTNRL